MRNDKFWLAGLAIIVIALLQVIALIVGVDGAVFGIVIAVIAGLAGYKIKPPSRK